MNEQGLKLAYPKLHKLLLELQINWECGEFLTELDFDDFNLVELDILICVLNSITLKDILTSTSYDLLGGLCEWQDVYDQSIYDMMLEENLDSKLHKFVSLMILNYDTMIEFIRFAIANMFMPYGD